MPEVFKIQTDLSLTGSLAPETVRLLRRMEQIETKAKAVQREVSGWKRPLDAASHAVERFANAMDRFRKGASHGVPTNDLVRWAAASARELADMRKAAQGVTSATRGIGKALDGWEGKINRSVRALERMERVASSIRMPAGPQGGYGGGRAARPGSGSSRGGGGHGGNRLHSEGSYVAGSIGVGGIVGTAVEVISHGAGAVREDIRAKNSGMSQAEIAALGAKASELTRQYPSLTKLGVREQGRLLVPNVGDFDKALDLLPEYVRGQVALQTLAGPEKADNEMEAFARFADIIGRSTSAGDTRKLIDGYIRARQIDPSAIKAQDYVNSAQTAAAPGKSLSVEFWAKTAPALFGQQGGSRTGTDLASAYQNFAIGRSTDEAILAQAQSGLREGFESKVGKNGKAKVVKKGRLKDEALYSSDPYEWSKKHLIPEMVSRGMLPQGYLNGDYSQELSDDQKSSGNKFLADRFSNRRGANIFSMMVQGMDQIEKFQRQWSKTKGTSDVEKDQQTDPYVVGNATKQRTADLSASALKGTIPDIVSGLVRFNNLLSQSSDFLEKHPLFAKGAAGMGLGLAGGIGAAGLMRLGAGGVGLLAGSPVSIAVGVGATVTILGALIPWKEIFGVGPKDLIDGFEKMAQPGYKADGKMPDLTKMPDGKTAIDAGKLKEGAGSIWEFIKSGATKTWDMFNSLARAGEVEQRKVAQGAKDVAAGAREVGAAAPQAKSGLDGLGSSILELMKKLIVSEGVIQQMTFGGGGGGNSGLIHRASLGGGRVNDGLGGGGGTGGGGTGGGGTGGGGGSGLGGTGGSRSWRNNNPGNIEYGPFARSMGAVGTDGRFARFPSYEAGRRAQERLLFDSGGYRDKTLAQAIRRWAPASENNVPAYLRAMGGGDASRRMRDHSPSERSRLLDAMQRHEGWRPGRSTRPEPQAPARPPVQPYQPPRQLEATHNHYLDGRKIAANTTKHMFDAANGPATGASFPDASELYPQA